MLKTSLTRSRKESEVFGWSRIFCPTPTVQLDHILHHTSKFGIPVEMVQFHMKLLLKQRILAVHHNFCCVLVATKFLTGKLHSLYVKESEILKGQTFYLRLRNSGSSKCLVLFGCTLMEV